MMMMHARVEHEEERLEKVKGRVKKTKMCRLVDKIMDRNERMRKHTSNLEAVVEDRTRQLMEEKAKIDHLLYNMMPA